MNLYEVRQLITKDIQETEEYSDFIRNEMIPMLTTVGVRHMEHLYFFNLGYQFALEKVEALLDKIDIPSSTQSENALVTQSSYQLAMYVIGRLMDEDPMPDTASGDVLRTLSEAVVEYEKANKVSEKK